MGKEVKLTKQQVARLLGTSVRNIDYTLSRLRKEQNNPLKPKREGRRLYFSPFDVLLLAEVMGYKINELLWQRWVGKRRGLGGVSKTKEEAR